MPRRATATIELQDALFGDQPAPPPAIPQPAADVRVTKLRTGHARPPRRDKDWNEATPCAPTCLACGRPEPLDDAPAWPLCPATHSRCATLCEHTRDAYRADVCLVTTHVHAQLVTLPETGRTVAAVTCPHCGNRHAHDPTPGRHYRVSRCRTARKLYIVHVPEKRSAESRAEPQTDPSTSPNTRPGTRSAPRPAQTRTRPDLAPTYAYVRTPPRTSTHT